MAEPKLLQIRDGFKTCTKCQAEKPLGEFRAEPRVKSGTTAQCKACLLEKSRLWAKENPERLKISRKKYAEKYPERIQASSNFSNRRKALERREKRIAAGIHLLEPRATEEGRRCSRCRRRKDISEFSPDKGHYDGVAAYCKSCASKLTRERLRSLSAPEKEKRRRWFRKYDVERRYGVSFSELELRLERQRNKCAICADGIDLFASRSACVDHNHKTKAIRGILCVKCNAGLGQFRDNVSHLSSAIKYLEKCKAEGG